MESVNYNYVLFDDAAWQQLLPLTYTRPVAEIRTGILTIREKWEFYLKAGLSYHTIDYLSKKFPLTSGEDNILINGSVLPSTGLTKAINALQPGQALQKDKIILAIRVNNEQLRSFDPDNISISDITEYRGDCVYIRKPWHIFEYNSEAIRRDFDILTKNRESDDFIRNNNIQHPENIFVEKGAIVEFATINASRGPVYIGKNAEVMEGAVIRGPFALCDHSKLKIGAKIYGPVTIGPYSKVGGEIHESVIFGYTNKAHDGYLGNSVLGEWCNIGADSNVSNLKNNYANVKLWEYKSGRFENTGLQFCGLIMGDHSKCGINTMFNTGTVVGVSANIFGSGFPRNFIPSFSWGGASGFTSYAFSKAMDVAGKVMERRNLVLNDMEQKILESVCRLSKKYRNY